MGRAKAKPAGNEGPPPVDLDAIQDRQRAPQAEFDAWCGQQDTQWATEMAKGVSG